MGIMMIPFPAPLTPFSSILLNLFVFSLFISVLHAVFLFEVTDFLAKSKISTCDAQPLQSRVLLYHSQSKYP